MVIVDTSVGFKWFDISEQDYSEGKKLLNLHLAAEISINVPELFFYEITNAWSTKSKLDIRGIKENFSELEKFKLNSVSVDFSLLSQAAGLSKTKSISVYDASFIALAQEKECDLVTADAKLVQKVNLPFVKLLSEYFI